MNDRYFGKVVAKTDKFTIVMNKGSENGVEEGDRFLVVGLGQSIIDSDTQEELGRLEIRRGNVSVFHIQERISSAHSCEFEKFSIENETHKITSSGGNGAANLEEFHGVVLEPDKPAQGKLKELDGAQIGDFLLKL